MAAATFFSKNAYRVQEVATTQLSTTAVLYRDEMPYGGPAISAFQKSIRGDSTVLRDHICKEMNALNVERCR